MVSFQHILFPVDFSGRSVQTAAYVAGIARKFKSRVTLLHAFDAHDPFGYGAASRVAVEGVPVPVLWQQREAAIAEIGSSVFNGVTVERVIQDGAPAETIARYVRDCGVDLIVMPTHGYGGFRRVLLGSVTAKVLHDVRCPVWTSAHSEDLDARCGQCIERIVCAVDFSSDVVDIVRTACELAQTYQATLRLVHAVGSDVTVEGAPFQRFLLETAREKMAAVQEETHTHLDTWVNHGNVAEVAREAALDFGAELCVIGRGHAGKLLGALRTNVNALVRESPCPVLSL